jgi:hypothetical protein
MTDNVHAGRGEREDAEHHEGEDEQGKPLMIAVFGD